MSGDIARRVVQVDHLSSEILSSIFVPIDVSAGRGVHGRYELVTCDTMLFVRATTGGGTFHVTRRTPRPHDIAGDAYFLCLPLHGHATLRQHDRECTLHPGDFGLLDARCCYGIQISSGCDALWARLPRARMDWPSRTMRTLSARRIDGSSGAGSLASGYIRELFNQLSRVPDLSHALLATIMIDLVSEAVSTAMRAVRPHKPTGRRTLERARAFIEHHLGEDDLTPARIAAGVGISPRYLSDLFASEGLTTMRHVVSRRLQRCREALAGEAWRPGLITELAFAHGFVNLSSFNRLFKNTYGMTPREVMQAAIRVR